jgi:cytidine deaminase
MDIEWDVLRREAVTAMGKAYAPYSNYPVGVAAVVDDGRLITACNVENASYGLGLCAECGLVSALAAGGGGRLVAMVCVDGEGAYLMPCGRCRQLLFEHGGPSMRVATADDSSVTVAELLPRAFGPHDLDEMAQKTARRYRDGCTATGIK